MKKIFKALICAGLVGAIAAGTLGAAGCGKKSGAKRDPEKDPLRLSIGAVDTKFNPMFYTAQNDGEIANMTQVSLITTDAEGKLRVGENYPTVALDYVETYYDTHGTVLATGDGNNISAAQGGNTNGDQNGTTTYEFVIKNGIKFSDGEPLTVLDVLFNLYVYLDPAYSGSSTIYSTRILGLQQYRQQDLSAGEDSDLSTAKYYQEADARIQNLLEYAKGNMEATEQILKDETAVKKQYKENLVSSWSTVSTSWVKAYENYNFTAAWQAYCLVENAIDYQYQMNEESQTMERVKDANDKYLTEFDPDHITGVVSSRGQDYTDGINAAVTDAAISEYMTEHPGATRADAELVLQGDYVVKRLSESRGVEYILTYTSTYSQIREAFMLDAMAQDTEGKEMVAENISGITVGHTSDSNYNNTFNGKTYSEDHDVLKVTIRGVDPKAKWNFGFSVAPLHYYSGTYNGVNYKQEALDEYAHRNEPNGTFYDGKATHFGVKYRDVKFLNEVLGNEEKSGLPIGAGAYKCCTYQYGSNPDRGTFFYLRTAYFERNENFTTLGSGVENAKIKYVTYRETSDDAIIQRLQAGEIDYGEPTATAKNYSLLSGFDKISYLAGGYGYVGINPKYVEDIDVRRGIMTAFNTDPIVEYYGLSLVNIIHRPMSTTSWAYPENATAYYPSAENGQDVIDVIEAGGKWVYNQANNTWRTRNNSITNHKFKYTFTIAGETTDHPAFDMFIDARNLLRGVGFDISVETDVQALQKLVTGDLAVWAAAWSSSIDPDPYQIYSLSSKASSTNNWYKGGIVDSGANGKYGKEFEIASQLNDKIMLGRRTLVQADRKEIYGACLDLIMELAVEYPTYQRNNLCVFKSSVLDINTMYTDRTGVGLGEASFNMAPLGELWKLNYVK